MKEIDLEELKSIELDILKDVTRFCDEYNLRYFLCGGTLLGAIRHKGFIPWDDDIDLIMPRKDYEKFFLTYISENGYYFADGITNNPNHWMAAGKVLDKRIVVKNNNEKYESSVWIDIFPTDGVPKNKIIRYLHFWHTKIVNYLYLSTVTTFSESKHYVDKLDKFGELKQSVRTFGKYILIKLFGNMNPSILLRYIDKQVSKYPISESEQIASQTACQYFMREIVDKKNFLEQVPVEFEGHKFWGPKGYDEYLTNLYGPNYMELPPVEKRKSRHDFEAYWKEGYGE